MLQIKMFSLFRFCNNKHQIWLEFVALCLHRRTVPAEYKSLAVGVQYMMFRLLGKCSPPPQHHQHLLKYLRNFPSNLIIIYSHQVNWFSFRIGSWEM